MSDADVWFILASGPSQCQTDIDAVRGRGKVIAINNQVFAAPWADMLYSCDASWWKHYDVQFDGERVSSDVHAKPYVHSVIPREAGDGMGVHGVRTGINSGYQAIQIAVWRGAKTIVLLGFDMQHGPNGEHHNHPDHPKHMGNFNRGVPETCAKKFPALAKDVAALGVRVVNCTRVTALKCFERMPLATFLASLNPSTDGQPTGLAPVSQPS